MELDVGRARPASAYQAACLGQIEVPAAASVVLIRPQLAMQLRLL
jgi:hypothetical protein